MGACPRTPYSLFCMSISFKVVLLNKKTIKKCGNYDPLFEVFRYATASPIFSVESRTSEECVNLFFFFCFPIRATLTIIVVEHINLSHLIIRPGKDFVFPHVARWLKQLPTPALKGAGPRYLYWSNHILPYDRLPLSYLNLFLSHINLQLKFYISEVQALWKMT